MALYLLKELDNTAKVAVWHITETEAELRELSSTPSDEMEEISFIKSESLRKQRLAVRALLNQLFEEKVYLAHHDNGKTYPHHVTYYSEMRLLGTPPYSGVSQSPVDSRILL